MLLPSIAFASGDILVLGFVLLSAVSHFLCAVYCFEKLKRFRLLSLVLLAAVVGAIWAWFATDESDMGFFVNASVLFAPWTVPLLFIFFAKRDKR